MDLGYGSIHVKVATQNKYCKQESKAQTRIKSTNMMMPWRCWSKYCMGLSIHYTAYMTANYMHASLAAALYTLAEQWE